MSAEEMTGFIIVGVVMLVGLIGTCVPGIPGAPLILAGAVAHKMYFGERSASYGALALLVALTVLSLVLDFLGTLLGAKKLGATWRGMTGAMIGGIIGIFFNLPGLILGPIIGAFVFEFAGGRAWKESAQAGAGAMLGLVLGALGKVACCVMMIGVFFASSFYNVVKVPAGTVLALSGQHAGDDLRAARHTGESFLPGIDLEAQVLVRNAQRMQNRRVQVAERMRPVHRH